eukprot:m.53492 g.53492  ORF g.53492 m.53492 type:complete len:134 (-) comp12388_c1_seq1:115-516(-)
MARNVAGTDEEVVSQACEILTVYAFCRHEAEEYRKCRESGGSTKQCQAPEQSYRNCAMNKRLEIIKALTDVANTKCPAEAGAMQRCLLQQRDAASTTPQQCDATILAALACGSRYVVASTKQPKTDTWAVHKN